MSERLEFQKVCDLDDVWEGEMDVFAVGDNEVLIIHAPGGQIRAYHPACPHQAHPLLEGNLENCTLTCSAHLWQFDVVSGEGINPTGTSLIRYPVKTEEEAIWVAVLAESACSSDKNENISI